MERERFDRIIQTWGARSSRRRALPALAGLAAAGLAGTLGAAGGGARHKRGKGGLKNGHKCNPAHPRQCRSGVCGCNGPTLCNCRTRHCAATGESCQSNFGCCVGVCQANGLVCVV
ncbi:MAG TPA: hypothetical protein VFU81_11000 [Thermomicrobiales bacterium]|nr:hypothetical protein [Thermomicrobiales bacterium]